jgi:sulfate transport system ATP-binding protein
MSIRVTNMRKRFGEFVALDGIDLEVGTGQLVALLGPSGCGKTTLLRIIAGLETADAGHVYLHGIDAIDRPVQDRRVGFVFQHYALFQHMSVFDNVAFGLTVRRRRERPSGAQIRDKVQELLRLVQLDWAHDRRPSQLSGGQRQRVALARALAVEPEVLLLDEPFGALDTQVRQELRRWLRQLHDALHFTSLFVTHDQHEALEVADAVAVLNAGRIEQYGTPQQVYDAPASAFVHRFVGASQDLAAQRQQGRVRAGAVEFADSPGPDGPVAAVVRPQDIVLARHGDGFGARIVAVRVLGSLVHVDLQPDEPALGALVAELTRERQAHHRFAPGEAVRVGFAQTAIYPR